MTATRAPAPAITPRSPDAPTPLSFPQEQLLVLERIMPGAGAGAYNVPALYRVQGRLDAGLLRRACMHVIERHEILRTRIDVIDGAPVAEVFATPDFDVAVLDVRDRPLRERLPAADAFCADLAWRPFDLAGDVLLRVALVHVGDDEDRLLVVLHHAASDHASRALLLGELDTAYAAIRDGCDPQLPALTVQYGDFAAWQRRELSGRRLEDLLRYWTAKLDGAPERVDLPFDRPRPAAQSYRGRVREFSLPADLVERVRELARRERATSFMVLLAAFQTLLHRYAAGDDIVVGTPISGRGHPEISNLLGYFSNTLALRTNLSRTPSFSELVRRVKATVIEAQVHQQLPFERLVQALNPARTESHHPVFQVLFGFDPPAGPAPAIAGRPLQALAVPGRGYSRFDLSLMLRERTDGSLQGRVEYATDLWDAQTIDRLIGHFRTLVEAAVDGPGRPISQLALLTESERELMLQTWNGTARSYDRRCLHELFAEQVGRDREALAVSAEDGRITYGELDERSNQLAHALRAAGVDLGARVGVCVERSVGLLVAMLGVLKAGAAYVPIEPSYPPDRQQFMLADAQAAALVCEQRTLGVVAPGMAAVLCLDRDSERICGQPVSAPPPATDVEALAYIIYTSGSTGRPKGVEVTHRSVVNLLAHMRAILELGAGDVMANVTTPAFDLSVPDWFLPLTSGARLAIVPTEATVDAVALADSLARTGATVMQATPTTWQLLVDVGWKGSEGLKIVCGGDALSPSLARDLRGRGAALWHMYGPTETTVWSSSLALRSDGAPVPIGGPIANTSFYVVDDAGHPVPIGVPGELWIGGDGVARGYHRRAELTAQKFIEDPFCGRAGVRVYRTGDQVRWRPDGTLQFHGRIDQQVKLRGYRIELGEIEAVLSERADVAAAVALVREDRPGDARLVAYVVPATPRGEPGADTLRAALRAKLPPHMVPSAFVVLDSLPLTANGKVDRSALPAPGDAERGEHAFCAPETPIQEELASIWQDVLRVDRVGIDDDFFALGGHSMLALRMLARVQATLGADIPLGSVFERATIRALSESVTMALVSALDDEDLDDLLVGSDT